MKSHGFSVATFARSTGIDARTIQRWIDGSAKPQGANALTAAAALECEPSDLWPAEFPALNAADGGTIAARVYPSRAHIPASAWGDFFRSATTSIDICVYGGTFLFDNIHGFIRLIRDAAEHGVVVRFAAGDPGSAAVQQRGEEEGIGASLAGRCRMTLTHLRRLAGVEGIAIRTHGTPLYASMFRVDDRIFVNHHIYGSPAGDNPIIEFDREADPDLWDQYATSFQTIWASARPATYPL